MRVSDYQDYQNSKSKDRMRANGLLSYAFCYKCGVETSNKNIHGLTECNRCLVDLKNLAPVEINEVEDHNDREWRLAIK